MRVSAIIFGKGSSFDFKRDIAIGIGGELLFDVQLRDGEFDLLRSSRALDLNVSGDDVLTAFLELHLVIAHMDAVSFHVKHIPQNSAVVPPIEVHGGNAIHPAVVVHHHHQIIFPIHQQVRNIELEGSETALMPTDLGAVQPDRGLVADSREVEKLPLILVFFRSEMTLIPDIALVIFQLGDLGIKITGHVEAESAAE